VPVLLGFIPTESLVIIYLDTVTGRSQIAMTARIDLPTNRGELTAIVQLVGYHAAKHDQMILVAYSVDITAAENTLRFLLDSWP
jgi:cephalosporin-C deacetylase-like acetyl esterase